MQSGYDATNGKLTIKINSFSTLYHRVSPHLPLDIMRVSIPILALFLGLITAGFASPASRPEEALSRYKKYKVLKIINTSLILGIWTQEKNLNRWSLPKLCMESQETVEGSESVESSESMESPESIESSESFASSESLGSSEYTDSYDSSDN